MIDPKKISKDGYYTGKPRGYAFEYFLIIMTVFLAVSALVILILTESPTPIIKGF